MKKKEQNHHAISKRYMTLICALLIRLNYETGFITITIFEKNDKVNLSFLRNEDKLFLFALI